MAGLMAEAACGQSFEALLSEHVMQPLMGEIAGGAASWGIGAAGHEIEDVTSRRNVPWGHGAQSNWKPKDPKDLNADNPAALTPAGRLNATVEAWARFLRIF